MIEKNQRIQDEEYWFPYHYVAQYQKGFTQCFNDTWGINYVATIEFLLSKIEEEDFASVVDIGCGDGRFTRELFQKFSNKKICGIDYSERAVQLAKAMNCDVNINFLSADITLFHLREKFDIAILMEVFEHIPIEASETFISSVANLLKKSGLLYITVPHVNKDVEYKHFRHFSIKSLRNCLEQHFEIIEIIPFEKRCKYKECIDKILTNNFFILNHSKIKNKLYSYYKKHLFFCKNEDICQRIFMKVRNK